VKLPYAFTDEIKHFIYIRFIIVSVSIIILF